MTVDNLSIENIDEFVNDENKIVTVKWLSLTLQVHCNTAKQLLYKFVQNERIVKDNDNITVTYFVSGLSKPDSTGEKAFKFAVVPEAKLETYKSTLEVITSCHIYSVQKIKLKDSNALYMTDYEKLKENVFESNKYSSIKNERAELRSEDELDLLRVPETTTRDEPDKKSSAAVTNGTSTTKPTSKKGPQTAIANMFAKAPQKKTAKPEQKTEDQEKNEVKQEKKTDKKDTNKASEKKAGGMMSFFPKQSEKKTESPTQKTEVKPVVKDDKKGAKGTTKKTARPLDSDEDEDNIGKTKRRRIKPDILDSSSDEEDMESEDEAPIPPTPPRQPSPAPREPSPEPEPEPVIEIEDSVPKKSSDDTKESGKGDNAKEPSKGGNSGERKRKRSKKLVPKTYMDKGFMVTEKVWESESTDASESEEPVAKVTKNTEATKPKASPVKGKQKGSPKKKSPAGKKGPGSAGSAKQTSLMSFFKKS